MAYYGTYSSSEDFSKKEFNQENDYKVNKRLLKNLLSIQAPSKNESAMQKYILSFINANKITCEITTDKLGNILVKKGNSEYFPCLVSHMDEVNSLQTGRVIIELNNHFIGMNPNTGEPAGCPGDDRCGVYLCLEALVNFENIKVAFFVSEEIGCVGSAGVDMEFFKDVAFVFQSDRRGDDEIITYSNGTDLMGQEFKDFIKPEMTKWNYKFGTGTSTDVGKLATRGLGVIGFNIGSGYFDPHTLKEKVCISAVENNMNLVFAIMGKCINEHKKFEYTAPKKKTYESNYNSYGGYGTGYHVETREEIRSRYKKRTLTAQEEKELKDFRNPQYWKNFDYDK